LIIIAVAVRVRVGELPLAVTVKVYDPAIIAAPPPVRHVLAWFLARRRAPVAREIYAKIGGRVLYDIDDLRIVCDGHLEERKKEALKVETIIEEEVEEFLDWWELQQNAVPTISSLVKKANRIREKEIAYTLSKMQGLTPEERERLEALARAITSKLLHSPISYIRKHRQDQKTMKNLEDIFNLNHDHNVE